MGKQRLTLLRALALIAGLVFGMAWTVPAGALTLSLTTAYAVDPLTGAALEGFDPVSYFTEGAPEQGRSEFEYYWSGVPWYFVTAANRDVFMRSPETYVPVFGGYAAMSMARGYLSSGNPRIYSVLAGKLFLFYSTGNKEAFLISPRDAYQKAQEQWAVLSEEAGF